MELVRNSFGPKASITPAEADLLSRIMKDHNFRSQLLEAQICLEAPLPEIDAYESGASKEEVAQFIAQLKIGSILEIDGAAWIVIGGASRQMPNQTLVNSLGAIRLDGIQKTFRRPEELTITAFAL